MGVEICSPQVGFCRFSSYHCITNEMQGLQWMLHDLGYGLVHPAPNSHIIQESLQLLLPIYQIHTDFLQSIEARIVKWLVHILIGDRLFKSNVNSLLCLKCFDGYGHVLNK